MMIPTITLRQFKALYLCIRRRAQLYCVRKPPVSDVPVADIGAGAPSRSFR